MKLVLFSQNPPQQKYHFFMHHHHIALGRIIIVWSMARHTRRSWSLTIVGHQDSFLWIAFSLALESLWGTLVITKPSFDLATIYGVAQLSHNMVTRENTIVGWILRITNVLVKNNGVLYITTTTPNKTFDAFILEVGLSVFFNVTIRLNTIISKTNDWGKHT